MIPPHGPAGEELPNPNVAQFLTALSELIRAEVAREIESGGTSDPWLTKAGVARYASMHISTVERLIRRGSLTPGRLGGDPRIRRSEVDRYLQRRDAERSEVDRAVDGLLQEVVNE